MEDFKIEKLKRTDVGEATSFARDSIRTLSFYNSVARSAFLTDITRKSTLKRLKSEAVIFIGKNKKGEVVGYVDYYPSKSGVGWIDWILVDSKYRRRKMGTALLKSVISFAKKHGAHAVFLSTRANNRKAIALFKALGFKKLGLFRRAWYKQDYYYWTRHL